jgi:hypothetical protein
MMMLLSTSFVYSQTIDDAEPLIKVYGKIMNRQYIEFLEKENDKWKITLYNYYIDIKKNIVVIKGGTSQYYDLNTDYIDIKHYQTSEVFRKKQSRWAKKYYAKIATDFLEMDNKKKMELLHKLADALAQRSVHATSH